MKTTLALMAALGCGASHAAFALPSLLHGIGFQIASPHKVVAHKCVGKNKSDAPSKSTTKAQTSSVTTKVLKGRCVSVLDGDTLIIMSGRSFTTVRLYAIDAPEKAQSFGIQAKDSLWELAFGQTLAVYPVQKEEDTVCGWVFAGKMGLNTEQVRQGWAWWDQPNAPRESKIAALESNARSAHLGLWHGVTPIAPWLWHPPVVSGYGERPMETVSDKR